MQRIDLDKVQRDLEENPPQQNQYQKPTPDVTAENIPEDHILWKLWLRFSEMYGHQWASQQGEEPNDTWIKGLADISPEQMAVGLRALLDRTDTWPPNLPAFRQLCLNKDAKGWERQAHKIYEPDRLLEDKTSKEAAHKAGEDFFNNLEI